MQTIRRHTLQRKAEAGRLDARVQYSADIPSGSWMPARIMNSLSDFVDGYINLYTHDFRTKSGLAYRNNDGTITLKVHSNLVFTLRERN